MNARLQSFCQLFCFWLVLKGELEISDCFSRLQAKCFQFQAWNQPCARAAPPFDFLRKNLWLKLKKLSCILLRVNPQKIRESFDCQRWESVNPKSRRLDLGCLFEKRFSKDKFSLLTGERLFQRKKRRNWRKRWHHFNLFIIFSSPHLFCAESLLEGQSPHSGQPFKVLLPGLPANCYARLWVFCQNPWTCRMC